MDQRVKAVAIGGLLIIISIAFLFVGIQQLLAPPGPPPATKEQRQAAFGNLAAGRPAVIPETKQKYDKAPNNILEDGVDYKAKLITNKGTVVIDLYEDKLPITVNNFVFLAKEGFYDGLTFHRVIPDFMIQGGDPDGTGNGGPGYAIPDEFVEGSTNIRGTIAMANAGPETGGSQFFINVVDNTRLDWDKEPATSKHPAFGIVVEGMQVVDQIAKVPTGQGDKPIDPIYIDSIEIIEE